MFEDIRKPRLVRYDDVELVVAEFRRIGIGTREIYRRIVEVGPVDLDMLEAVLAAGKRSSRAA